MNNKFSSLSKKQKLILISIIVLVLIGILWLIFSLQKSQQNLKNDPYTVDNQPVFESDSPKLELISPSQEASTEFTVANLAKTFVARFGSWSTDNQGENLQQLLSLATNSMKNYINSIEINYQREDFYGVSTKSLSAEVESLDEENGQAKILVHTQRVETDNNLVEKIYYQDVLVYLVNSNQKWLVNQVDWQE
ncbi:hypothetical protein H6761_02590 [Candidatus Nomurabacteria bacterium]|nr:hypothetical protein [Candidatus Nomurabacteria bacterium]